MDIVFGIIGILAALTLPVIIIMVVSKIFNTNYSYRGEIVAKADDLDNFASGLRKKVDKNFAQKQRIEKEYRIEHDPIEQKIGSITFNLSMEKQHLRRNGYSESEINSKLNKKYNPILKPLIRKSDEIKNKYKRMTGYTIK